MADELEILQAVSVLTIEPGDVLVFKTDRELSLEQARHLHEVFNNHPALQGARSLVLHGGLDVGVLRGLPEDAGGSSKV